MIDKSVLFFADGSMEAPTAFYRSYFPAWALRTCKGYDAYTAEEGIITKDGRFTVEGVPPPTVCVIRRPVESDMKTPIDISKEITQARKAGQRVWLDLDDNLWDLPSLNPARKIIDKKALRYLDNIAEACTGIICSTKTLAARAARQYRYKRIVTCHNGIDTSLYDEPRTPHEKLRVGWLGPVQWRHQDILSIRDWLVPTLNSLPGVEFVHLGVMPSDEVSIEELLPGAEFEVTSRPWVPFPCLGGELARIDVLIIPQHMDEDSYDFAVCRSATSGMVAVASDCAIWATPIPSYRELFGSSLPEPTADGLHWLLSNEQYRQRLRKLQYNCLEYVSPFFISQEYNTAFEWVKR